MVLFSAFNALCSKKRGGILEELSLISIKTLEEKAKLIGLTETVLIENASSSLCVLIDSFNLGKNVLVVAGKGNNGADVLCSARKLMSSGYDVKIAVLEEKELGKETALQKDILNNIGALVYSINKDSLSSFKELLRENDFILEGILGVGVRGQVDSFLAEIISLINNSTSKIISCDIPSGLNPDTGIPSGISIKADYTITFLAAKKGFSINQGPELCGKLFVADIGISCDLLERIGKNICFKKK